MGHELCLRIKRYFSGDFLHLPVIKSQNMTTIKIREKVNEYLNHATIGF